MVKGFEDSGLYLNLEALCSICDNLGSIFVVSSGGILKTVCTEVQSFFVSIIHGVDDS